jgi:virginiamycin B lyase
MSHKTCPALAGVFALAGALICVAQPASAQQDRPPFPDGHGRDIFVAACGTCHDLDRARTGYTPDGWRTVMRMMQNFGVSLPPQSRATLTAWLIESFPEPERPPAVVIGGVVEAAIKLFPVPAPGSRPHDPLAARDGSIWYTGQMSNRLGRLDPATGATREFALPTPRTGPHGLAEDRAGNIWYRQSRRPGRQARSAHRLVSEYRMPDRTKDPHSVAIDPAAGLVHAAAKHDRPARSRSGARSGLSPTPGAGPTGCDQPRWRAGRGAVRHQQDRP